MKWVALFLLLLVAGCAGPNSPKPPKPPAAHVSRLDITPAGVLLTTAAPSQTLSVQVLDQNGQVIKAAVTWTSSNSGVVSVTADGKVTAHSDLGSARITAQAEGVKASIVAVVAQPVAGAVLVTDEQIVGDPQPVDASAQFGVGFRYTVELQGVPAPSIGAILLTSGEKQVVGKVVAVDGNKVTLEMVPIDEVFAKLDINESIDLSEAPFTTPEAIAQNFETTRLPDGRIRLRLKEGRTFSSSGLQPQGKFHAGPFECETEFSAVQVDIAKAELTFNPTLHEDIIWNDSQQKMVVRGQPKVSLQLTSVLTAAVNGKVTCKWTFREIRIPVPGPAGAFLGGIVPFGAGFELEGKLPIAGFGAQTQGVIGVNLAMGFDCNPDCKPVHSLANISDGDATPVLPKVPSIKLEGSLYAFEFADLQFGMFKLKKARITLLESAAGFKVETKLASEETQAADKSYSSSYSLNFEAAIGAGPKPKSFFKLVNVTALKLEQKLVINIANSPTGTVSADTASFKTGDTVTFKVKLNPDNVDLPVVGYNVDSVRVYRRVADVGLGALELVKEVQASDGQTEFELPWVATIDGEVKGNFVAFVKTKDLPELRLELGDATAPQPGGTLTFTEIEEEHDKVSEPDHEGTDDVRNVWEASYQLRKVSEDGGAITFEIIGGSASATKKEDEHDVHREDNKGCVYNETNDRHASYSGSVTPQGTVSVVFNPDNTYALHATRQDVTMSGSVTFTDKYEILEDHGNCPTDSTSTVQGEVKTAVGLSVSGTVDPNNPKVLSGTTTDGDETEKGTTTWTLVLP